MHRTQIYLEEAHYQALRARARREGKTMAGVLREILDRHFGLAGGPVDEDPFDGVIGIAEGDGSAVAEHVEDYLYGADE